MSVAVLMWHSRSLEHCRTTVVRSDAMYDTLVLWRAWRELRAIEVVRENP